MDNEKEPTPTKALVPNQSIPDKLLEFQKRVSSISKDSVNPFFKSKYFDVNTVIDTIKPVLNEVGLTVIQGFGVLEGKNILETLVKDGTSIIADSQIILPEIVDVQKFGAAITYIRRYALVSLLLLQGEADDDGNGAVKQKTTQVSTSTPKTSKKAEFDATGQDIRASVKQIALIKTLVKQKGQTGKVTEEQINNLSLPEAKKWIDRLLKMENKEDEIVIQIDNPVPYVEGHEND